MSKKILSIAFNLLENGNVFVETQANKSLSKSEVYLMVKDYLENLERMIKDEAN
jgi:Tfp pilus assembly protein PilZ